MASRSTETIALLRSWNVVRSRLCSSQLGTVKTRAASSSFAYVSPPVAVLAPSSSVRAAPLTVKASRRRGVSSPNGSRLAGFSSMTRVRSSVARLLVTPDTSLASAGTCTGASIFQPAPSFFSVVTSPLEAVRVSAAIWSASSDANTFSVFGSSSAGSRFISTNQMYAPSAAASASRISVERPRFIRASGSTSRSRGLRRRAAARARTGTARVAAGLRSWSRDGLRPASDGSRSGSPAAPPS